MTTTWLVDKSALARLGRSADSEVWAGRIGRGLVAITSATLLEVGYSATSAADWGRVMHGVPISAMPVEYLTPAMEDRALEVQGLLAAKGQHRAPSIPELLIAAVAELSSRVVLHQDKDYDLIAEVTGQPVEALV